MGIFAELGKKLASCKKCIVVFLLAVLLSISGCEIGREKGTDGNVWLEFPVYFAEQKVRTDNPWGFNCGIIDTPDSDEKAIFLTPGTMVSVDCSGVDNFPSLKMRIHPWVAEDSDGAEVLVRYLDEDYQVIEEKSIVIDSKEESTIFQPKAVSSDNITEIQIVCGAGSQGDASADWVVIELQEQFPSSFGTDGYVRSATYFGKEWAINFWNSDLDCLDDDLLQIRQDGFDSIVLVIPWREFQTDTDPVTYSSYAFDSLDRIMKSAESHGLMVYARIGYFWDFYKDTEENIYERYLNLMIEKKVQLAWLDYASVLYETFSSYSNFRNAFLTWEDFWGNLVVCDLELSRRIEYARKIGYHDWILENYTLSEYNREYGACYEKIDSIPVPQRNEPAMKAFYSFYDEYLNSLLTNTQMVFPNLSMEIRLDADVVTDKEGNQSYYSHEATYLCGESDVISAMYSIPMGCENKGEKISAEDAQNHTEYILSCLKQKSCGKPVFLEQFLYLDDTPQFSYNAQIQSDEVDAYLRGVSKILLEYSAGYGIWTYRNYQNNMVYNNGFSLRENGWTLQGNVKIELDGQSECHISPGGSIEQPIPAIRNHFDADTYMFTMTIKSVEQTGIVRISMGNESKNVYVSEDGQVQITFSKNDSFDLKLESISAEFDMDDIKLYSFTQNGHLYDVDNDELEYIASIRFLNNKLKSDNEKNQS